MYLYGSGGHCNALIEAAHTSRKIIHRIYDDNPARDSIGEIPVSFASGINKHNNNKWVIAIGNNKLRKKISETIEGSFTRILHSNSLLAATVKTGEGTVVLAGVIINANAVIGKHCIINTGALVEHDCSISDFVHIAPRCAIAGNVTIGEGSFVGINSTVINGITIGKWALVGAGAVVVEDVPDYAVVMGNPARIVRYQNI